jgi:glycosyltransferase involved in cell wall biosynthesis
MPLPVSLALLSAGELFGGVERHLLDLSRHRLARFGCAPLVVLFHDGRLARRCRELGLEPVIIDARGAYDPAIGRQLARVLRNHGTALVHTHGYRAIVGAALARMSDRRARFQVVKTEHGRPEHQRGLSGRSRMNHALGLWATRRIASSVSYVSSGVAKHYERLHRGLQRVVIHNGVEPVDRSAFPRPECLPPGCRYFAVVGRLTAVKGIGYALQAMASPSVPADVRLLVVGDGPLRGPLEAQAEASGIAQKVRFLGFRRDALAIIAHAEALLMPSLHEGLPYSLLEAMSLGVAVVASDVGGPRELLTSGETGFLVSVGDVESLRKAMLRLASEPGLADQVGAAAASLQRRCYTLELMGLAYERWYRETLARQEATPP